MTSGFLVGSSPFKRKHSAGKLVSAKNKTRNRIKHRNLLKNYVFFFKSIKNLG